MRRRAWILTLLGCAAASSSGSWLWPCSTTIAWPPAAIAARASPFQWSRSAAPPTVTLVVMSGAAGAASAATSTGSSK